MNALKRRIEKLEAVTIESVSGTQILLIVTPAWQAFSLGRLRNLTKEKP
jgi:hypothetical protein